MNWKFWEQQKPLEDDRLGSISDGLKQLLAATNGQQFEQLEMQIKENAEMINRLSRLQYKMGQELINKVTPIYDNLGDVTLLCQKGQAATELAIRENSNQMLVSTLIDSIDTIDGVMQNTCGNIPDEWRTFLKTIQISELDGLARVGIRELELLGSSFNPIFAEAVEVRAIDQLTGQNKAMRPYEVIEVLRRGFIDGEGKVVRKAQVITLTSSNQL
ncbi:nucleotide exchange factor GrpE [Acetobacterium wieringae]|uniref:GrpE n=1 Tax=Acetobacterium wieringae TaxID=52694 RepID=A0A1F2PLN7_9FIRM|nr:nucleotide exchange factor GrpE [Acetobacterium wieringae]OFV71662.1 GrpE [Acetobacterium wieringae]